MYFHSQILYEYIFYNELNKNLKILYEFSKSYVYTYTYINHQVVSHQSSVNLSSWFQSGKEVISTSSGKRLNLLRCPLMGNHRTELFSLFNVSMGFFVCCISN